MDRWLIDAWKLCEYANNLKDKQIDANDIMRFPTIDAVEVVRCGECMCWSETWKSCGLRAGAILNSFPYEADDYCSKGVRKDGR